MRVFLYEFISGGGCFHSSIASPPDGSLLAEGLAMWQAVYDDLNRIDGVEVITTRDARLPPSDVDAVIVDNDDLEHFVDLAKQCDFSLVIAPEFGGHLFQRVELLEQKNCKHLGSSAEFIQVASDKTTTAERLAEKRVRVPSGKLIRAGERFPSSEYPVVCKVNDGAGSMGTVVESQPLKPMEQTMRVEEFVSGTPCSQSFLCFGDRQFLACPTMYQRISDDGQLTFQGGERVRDSALVARTTSLGIRALNALPPTQGYVGIDLVLGDDQDSDYVIEVNPRLTTSYIGLRQLTNDNLVRCMLDIAAGKKPFVNFHDGRVRFLPDGTTEI